MVVWIIRRIRYDVCMRILAIETSCDETAVAVVDFSESADGVRVKVVAESLHSQADAHRVYGGVYPSLAKREHQKILPHLLYDALRGADLLGDDDSVTLPDDAARIAEREPLLLEQSEKLFSYRRPKDIDAIAVTNGPGLAPALWVGVNFARILSLLWNLPIIPVNHMEGHIHSALLNDDGLYVRPAYPLLSLLVSGGHTELVLTPREGVYKKIGSTRDDAAGEAFDKVARMLGLPYPGGPAVSALADTARERGVASPVSLPRPMLGDDTLNFSYAGLKTAVRVFIEKNEPLTDDVRMGVAREFEDAVVETLLKKTERAIVSYAPTALVIGGGVSANRRLRECFTERLAVYSDISLRTVGQETGDRQCGDDCACGICETGCDRRHTDAVFRRANACRRCESVVPGELNTNYFFLTPIFFRTDLSIFGIVMFSMPSRTSAFDPSTSTSAGRSIDRENEPNESSSYR